MISLTEEMVLKMTEEEIREHFKKFIENEVENGGLVDLKFSVGGEGTVVDTLRQLLMIKVMKESGKLEQYHD